MIPLNIYDSLFLAELDQYPNKEISVRITALNKEEQPLQSLEGYVTTGSINIDGASAIRRTCSLTLVVDYNQLENEEAKKFFDYTWGVRTRFSIEIGVNNDINSKFPKTIWFQQGVFIITSLNISYSTNNFSMTIQGKDKMCLLNGEVAGSLEAQIDFGKEIVDGITRKIPIKEIIYNAVHTFGGEPYHNIIINDLESYGLELLEYCGNSPMYLLRQGNDVEDEYLDFTTNGDTEYWNFTARKKMGKINQLENPNNSIKQYYDHIGNYLLDLNVATPTKIQIDNSNDNDLTFFEDVYTVVKIESGNIAGYKTTDLIYSDDLIANIGESLTSVLDKLVKMLGYFEYFYDVEGHFVFQKKPQYISEIWGRGLNVEKEDKNEPYLNPYNLSTTYSYVFNENQLITSIAQNPDISNIKNDFIIWGEREGISGVKIPIHMRCAIDKKPISYSTIIVDANEQELKNYNKKYGLSLEGQETSVTYIASTGQYREEADQKIYCDWREVIYRMACDYYKYNFLSDFLTRVQNANSDLYPGGITNYEPYYLDLKSYWRDLYYPSEVIEKEKEQLQKKIIALQNSTDNSDIEQQKIYKNEIEEKNKLMQEKYYTITTEYNNCPFTNNTLHGWNQSIINTPELLNFWFDFIELDEHTDLEKYSIPSIGRRPKVVNNTKLHSIYYPEVPTVIYVPDYREKNNYFVSGDYSYLQWPGAKEGEISEGTLNVELFTPSSQYISIKEELNTLLNTHTYYTETVNLTTVPIYYLEPNTRISLVNSDTSVLGDYFVSKITIPLTYNGTMQLTTTKIIDNII